MLNGAGRKTTIPKKTAGVDSRGFSKCKKKKVESASSTSRGCESIVRAAEEAKEIKVAVFKARGVIRDSRELVVGLSASEV